MNKRAPHVIVCGTYRFNETVVRLANALAAKHAADIHVGRYIDEETGEVSPGFVLRPIRASQGCTEKGELDFA